MGQLSRKYNLSGDHLKPTCITYVQALMVLKIFCALDFFSTVSQNGLAIKEKSI